MKFTLAAAGGLTALLTLASCGGGEQTDALRLTNVQPTSIRLDIYEGEWTPRVQITGALDGDLNQLSGKNLYIYALVPEPPMFNATNATFSLGADKRSGTLSISGVNPPPGAQTYSNSLVIKACLDSLCKSELAGSGVQVPYVVDIHPGLKPLSTSAVQMDSSFGSPGAPLSIPLQMPAGSTWRVVGTFGSNPSYIQGAKADDGSQTVVVSMPELSLPGTLRQGDIGIEAVTPDGHTLRTGVHVTTTTSPSGVPVAFQQASTTIKAKQGDPFPSLQQSVTLLAPGGDASRIKFLGIDYTWPPAAESNTFKNHWVVLSSLPATATLSTTGFHVNVCNAGTSCLPSGTYTATFRYQYSPLGGTASNLAYVATLHIVP